MNTRPIAVAALCLLSMLTLSACGPTNGDDEAIAPGAAKETGRFGDLEMTLKIDEQVLVTGETLPVTVTVTNIRQTAPVEIEARSSARVIVELLRWRPEGWQQVARYPQAALMVLSPWTLKAGQTRTFELDLPVEPNWPTHETLDLRARLNGVEDAKLRLPVRVIDNEAAPAETTED